MNFFLAMLVWFVISLLLGIAIYLATVKGSFIFLGVFTVAMVVAVWKIGCSAH